MRKIYKYPLPKSETFTINVPKGGRILHIDVQFGHPEMWILIDPEASFEDREFFIAMTGQEIPEARHRNSEYVGTFLLSGGDLVLHLFERRYSK